VDVGSLNYTWGLSIVHAYVLSGVQHAVISPGSRSTPLTLACERHPDMKTWVQVDERSAAFFALGLAIKSRKPVILVCTSGSAVANWFPAVVEANHSEISLILLSADRPAELQNCGANQTIDQKLFFGSHVRAFHGLDEPSVDVLQTTDLSQIVAESISESQGTLSGPVHLNIPFREPLLPLVEDLDEIIDGLTQTVIANYPLVPDIPHQPRCAPSSFDGFLDVVEQGDGLIVVGRDLYSAEFIQALNLLAEGLKVPVIVDHLSNLRFGQHKKTNYIVNYDLFLQQDNFDKNLAKQPDWIIRFGEFPVSKYLAKYLSTCFDAVSIVVGNNARKQDPLLMASFLIQSPADTFVLRLLQLLGFSQCNGKLLASFKKQDRVAAAIISSAVEDSGKLSEGHIVTCLLDGLEDKNFIFTANSTAVRMFDTFAINNKSADKNLKIVCNRGASGIDGNLSTYLGLLADDNSNGVAVLGDLAFFHDLNGLALCAELNRRGVCGTIIIMNNNGGHIFNSLPQHSLREFEQYWLTPLNIDFSHAAALFGLGFQQVDSVGDFKKALLNSFNNQSIDIIEAVIDQKASLKKHDFLLQQIKLINDESRHMQ